MKIQVGDVIRCKRCNHVYEISESWLFTYGNRNSSEICFVSDSRLRCTKCSEKGSAVKSSLSSGEMEMIERDLRFEEIKSHVDTYGGDPDSYTRITKGSWWSSDEANYEDILLRAREEDVERNRKADRE